MKRILLILNLLLPKALLTAEIGHFSSGAFTVNGLQEQIRAKCDTTKPFTTLKIDLKSDTVICTLGTGEEQFFCRGGYLRLTSYSKDLVKSCDPNKGITSGEGQIGRYFCCTEKSD